MDIGELKLFIDILAFVFLLKLGCKQQAVKHKRWTFHKGLATLDGIIYLTVVLSFT